MSSDQTRTFSGDFKRFFGRGLAVLLPSVLTLWILVKAYQFIDSAIAQPINAGVRAAMAEVATQWQPIGQWFEPTAQEIDAAFNASSGGSNPPTRPEIRADLIADAVRGWWSEWAYALDWIGILLAVLGVYVAGRLLGGFLGRRVQRRIEDVITSVPIFKQVYPYVKQVVDFIFSDDKPIKFNRVVAVQYPRPGIWSVGLVTGNTMKSIHEESGDALTIFIPSSPTPFTGYTITVPRTDVHELPISIDEALRFTISGGVLVPPHEALAGSGDGDSPGAPPNSASPSAQQDGASPKEH